MKSPYYHSHIDLHYNRYFFDYIQTYFPLPQDDIKLLDGFNWADIDIWLKITVKDLQHILRKHTIDKSCLILADTLHKGIKFHFKGGFFKSDNWKDDLKRFKKIQDELYQCIIENQYNPTFYTKMEGKSFHDEKIVTDHKFLQNLCSIQFPRIYISRFDLSENLYYKDYPDGLMNNNYDIYSHGHMQNNKNCENNIWMDSSSHIQTGHAFGVRKHLRVTVYAKNHDKGENSIQNAIDRFGSYKFWRREYQVAKKKIKSMNLNHYDDFLLMLDKKKGTKIFKFMVTSIRKTLDIVLKNDLPVFACFHYNNIDSKHAKEIGNYFKTITKKQLLAITGDPGNYVPLSKRNTLFWDGVDNIVGITKSHKHKWSHEKWMKILDELFKEPDRIALPKEVKDYNVNIKRVKEFLEQLEYK